MPRKNSGHGDLLSEHLDARRARDGNYADESTRRKMLRWIKKTIGIHGHGPEDADERHRRRHHNRHDEQRGRAKHTAPTRGIAPPGYLPKSHKPQREPARASLTGTTAMATDATTGSSSKSNVTILLYDEDELKRTLSNASAPSSCRSNASNASRRSQSSTRSATTPSSAAKRSIYEYHHQLPQYQFRNDQPRPQDPNDIRVLIIGGGIGGLCLAQGLKKHGIPFTVFERDPSPNYRTQGYRLRINSAGYEALKATLTKENFEVFLQSTGQFFPGFVHLDAHTTHVMPEADGVEFLHDAEITKQVFSANRAMLRSLLLTDLYEGVEIQYGMGFERYNLLPNGRVEAHFENGDVVQGTVLIGADGTTSRVRRQLVPRHVTLLDTDSGVIYGKTRVTRELEQLGLASDCTTMITSQNPKMSMLIEPQCKTKLDLSKFQAAAAATPQDHTELPDLHKYVSWMLLARADLFHVENQLSVQDLYAMEPEEIANVSAHLTADWHPHIRAIVELQAPEWGSFMRISTMAPEIRAWAPCAVTLIGDAVHTMAPAGIGCNAALQDASFLCDLFLRYGVNVEAITHYETAMRTKAREGIVTCIEAGKRMYNLPALEDMTVVIY